MRSLTALLMLSLPAMAEVSPDRAEKLEHMVIQDCGSCHGLTMKGGLGSALTPDVLAHAEPEGLALIILDGVPGTAMPRWRPVLSEDEALWIARYLKGSPK
ncbi:MAG: cytochrome c [Albidovulum sp.]|uniref:c-type cytochrome n=1 Tax=Albidovulum sp. TaxID=1872424 RepID=UPI003CBCD555